MIGENKNTISEDKVINLLKWVVNRVIWFWLLGVHGGLVIISIACEISSTLTCHFSPASAEQLSYVIKSGDTCIEYLFGFLAGLIGTGKIGELITKYKQKKLEK